MECDVIERSESKKCITDFPVTMVITVKFHRHLMGTSLCPVDGNSTVKGVTDSFAGVDGSLGILCFILFVGYTIYTVRDFCKNKPENKGAVATQVWFIISTAIYAVSYSVSAFLKSTAIGNWGLISLVTCGTAGYVSAIAYGYIFFSWTSMCAILVGKDFSAFSSRSGIIIRILLAVSIICYVVSLILVIIPEVDESKAEMSIIAHTVEAMMAVIRDLFLSVAFIVYHIKIKKLSDPPHYITKKPEARLFRICLYLIISLIGRAISVLVYTFYWASWTVAGTQPYKECNYGYFAEYTIEQVLFQVAPLFLISLVRYLMIKEKQPTLSMPLFVDYGDFE